MKILITGGAGFFGSSLAKFFRQSYADSEIIAFDNLKRRGSELNLPELKSLGVRFVHGDIRLPSDFLQLDGEFDLIIDASAEPSVHAGTADAPDHVVGANLTGTFNCLNFARNRTNAFLFLSTSRVYSMAPLRELPLTVTATRFEMQPPEGISEDFPTNTARSLYGATKLASEMLLQEFVALYGLNAVVYRCGVIAGPGQFGKPDQGVFTLWLVRHYFHQPLQYTGFGGEGKQVRDLLHPLDLADLIAAHLPHFAAHRGQVFNVGGGRPISVSLRELTGICRRLTGNAVPVGSDPTTSAVDIPLFITDTRRIRQAVDWAPRRNTDTILQDTLTWIRNNETQLQRLFF
jgi:CDP-paratose 2-epimerase